MKKELPKYKEVERTIIKEYRKSIWTKFIEAINTYHLIEDGDKIAVCISGGKDSMLLAKCFQELKAHGNMNFDVVYISMNPGYTEEVKQKVIDNAKLLNIPLQMFDTEIFAHVDRISKHPCFICARMRRGHLYKKAKELGCNKIALGHHFDDVIETTLLGMLYGSQIQGMLPKLPSTYHPGMEVIRPLYLIKEADIVSWQRKNGLEFINCACKITIKNSESGNGSKRATVKALIKDLRKDYKNIDINIFRSIENVNLDTLVGYKKDGVEHNFLDTYEEYKASKVKKYEEERKYKSISELEEEDKRILDMIDGE